MIEKDKLYSDYSEKFLRSVILYSSNEDEMLYHDYDCTKPVYRDELENLFFKNYIVVYYGGGYYIPFFFGELADFNEIYIMGLNGGVETELVRLLAPTRSDEEVLTPGDDGESDPPEPPIGQ